MIQLNANHFIYLLQAAQWTVLLSLIAFVGGSVVGLGLALLRVSKIGVLRVLASGYIQLIQGTPLLIVLFLSYFGLGIMGFKLVPRASRSRSTPRPSWERSGAAASRPCRAPSGKHRTASASTASSNMPT